MEPIVVDQTLIAIPGYPRPVEWWQSFAPGWLTITQDGDLISMIPNGRLPNGRVIEMTKTRHRRLLEQGRRWLAGTLLADAVLPE